MRPLPARWRRMLCAIGIAAFFWLIGFIVFLVMMSRPIDELAPGSVDGIVVLTGGSGRVQAGIAALERGVGKRLLVSGVNPDLAPGVIRSAIGGSQDIAACCIDLGDRARDTEGNAAEALAWADRQGYRSLAVITSDWHMLRAMVEFRRIDPERRIVPIPVEGGAGPLRLVLEYNKYLYARARALLG